MKKLLRTTSPIKFDIEVILYPKFADNSSGIAASTYRGYDLPDGALMPADKNIKISEQQIIDYETFIADVEDMLKNKHELKLIYQNKSADYSNYYTFLAVDNMGNPYFRFRLRLRVSTHDPRRSSAQKLEIAKEEKAVQEYLKGRKKPDKMTKIIVVNDESEYDNYLDAFVDICDIVDTAIEKMQR